MVNDLHGAVMVEPPAGLHQAEDPHDSLLLALADVARANALVTGEKRAGLLTRTKVGQVRILTAAAFCQDVLRDGH